ncbi:hypothetical protein DPMN_146255 [Dreissena polymorpha]|uniref:Uncharacterized protein n=1 Tax=Dreissena polymorpha TaxID=45954 RepID=A0A9D4IY92_DREPO|nr:hypothetical protein DPMN_146255 [Dreissena polymorpha]
MYISTFNIIPVCIRCRFCTFVGVAVSHDGKRIYRTENGRLVTLTRDGTVTRTENGRLVTLTRDGTVTATIKDPTFKHSMITCSIHMATTGQVFVFGNKSVSQVDTGDKTILDTVDVDGCPSSIYFNVDNGKLLVGIHDNDSMTEFKTMT